ncbi:MAG: hypothetical protein RIS34_2256, partial [Pseudomonadota bacterium]
MLLMPIHGIQMNLQQRYKHLHSALCCT